MVPASAGMPYFPLALFDPSGSIERLILAERKPHAIAKAFGKSMNLPRLAAAVNSRENANAVAGRSFVLGLALMGIIFDNPDPALPIDGNSGGGDDVGFPGDQLHDQAIVGRNRRRGLADRC